MTGFLPAAMVAAFACVAFHVVVGGRRILQPVLQAAEIPGRDRLRFHYLWHLVTVLLLTIAAGYLHGVLTGGRELAIAATAIAAVCSLWTLAFAGWQRQSLRRFPQWALFGGLAALGLAALA